MRPLCVVQRLGRRRRPLMGVQVPEASFMLSRVADSIYWMSRYVDRVENIARFIDVALNISLDQPVGTPEQWLPLVMTTGDHDYFKDRYGDPTQQNVIQFLTFDREYPHSILSSLTAARENARSIR